MRATEILQLVIDGKLEDAAEAMHEALAQAHSDGYYQAIKGIQEVFGPEDGTVDMPDAWYEKPFCRICMYEDKGDWDVGIPGSAYWALAKDQIGTVLADIIANNNTLPLDFDEWASNMGFPVASTQRPLWKKCWDTAQRNTRLKDIINKERK